MFRVLLIRPGTTDYDEQGRIKGQLSIPLNAQGKDQVAKAVHELADIDLEAIYVAPCEAALETGEALSRATRIKLKKADGLLNLGVGLWQGKLIEEIRTKHPKVYRRWQEQPQTMCPPEGEMLSAAQQRLTEMIERIGRKLKDGATIALVVAEPLATILCAASETARIR